MTKKAGLLNSRVLVTMKHLLRRIFSRKINECLELKADSTAGTSQESLLGRHLNEKERSSFDDDTGSDVSVSLNLSSALSMTDLPDHLILRISSFLHDLSKLSLKSCNSSFRNIIEIDDTKISRCTKWRMLVHLENDLLEKDMPWPSHLACTYCKRAHPKEDFGVQDGNAGYGIECLFVIESMAPMWRFCWRYVPSILDYSGHIVTAEHSSSGRSRRKQQKEYWKTSQRAFCGHCFNKLEANDTNGALSCRHCKEQCIICGHLKHPIYERHGPERPLESYRNIRFVRRSKKDWDLEIRDLNGIRDPHKPPPPEPKVWKQESFWAELKQEGQAEESLVHSWRISRNRFPLYSDAKDITVPETDIERWQWFPIASMDDIGACATGFEVQALFDDSPYKFFSIEEGPISCLAVEANSPRTI